MTTKKDFKKLVRQRMDKTGESYTTAHRHLVGDGPRANLPEPIAEDLERRMAREREQEIESYGIEVLEGPPGMWTATTKVEGGITERGRTSEEARQRLISSIWAAQWDWRNAVDPDTILYLENQDDD